MAQHRLGDRHLAHRRLDFLLELDVEIADQMLRLRLVGHAQPAAHQGERAALQHQRNQRADKHHVENLVAVRHRLGAAQDGKDDGHRPSQPAPRDKQLVLEVIFSKGYQREEDAQRPRHEDHQQTDEDARQDDAAPRQLARVHQEAQREEHRQLAQPRHTLEEVPRRTLVHEAAVAEHQAADIDRQIAVAFHVKAHAEDEDARGEHQDGIQRGVVDLQLVDEPHQPLAQGPAHHGAHDNLHKDHRDGRPVVRRPLRRGQGDERDCHHVGHRVVAAALQLQGRFQAVLQIQPLGTKDGENRGRVGRGHRAGQQQRGQEAYRAAQRGLIHNQPDAEARGEGRDEHAQRGQRDAGAEHRLDVANLRVHAAREKDDAQRHRADALRHADVVELDAQPVHAEEHTHHQKQQQHRHAQLAAGLAHDDARKKEQRDNE